MDNNLKVGDIAIFRNNSNTHWDILEITDIGFNGIRVIKGKVLQSNKDFKKDKIYSWNINSNIRIANDSEKILYGK